MGHTHGVKPGSPSPARPSTDPTEQHLTAAIDAVVEAASDDGSTTFAVAAGIARWISKSVAEPEEAAVAFEDVPPFAVQTLGLNRDGVVPLAR